MTEPTIHRLKPQKLTVKVLKANGKYRKIKGLLNGFLIIYSKYNGDSDNLIVTLSGQLIGNRPSGIPEVIDEEGNEEESNDSMTKSFPMSKIIDLIDKKFPKHSLVIIDSFLTELQKILEEI